MNRRLVLNCFTASCAWMATSHLSARPLHFLLEQKVKTYRGKMETWAQSPELIAMARNGFNQSDAVLAAADWDRSSPSAAITALLNNDVSRKLSTLARDPAIANLTLLNSVGAVLGSSSRPRAYNMGDTLAFTEAVFSGATWSARRSRLDPVLNREVIALSTPIFERNREIGVLYMQLSAD